MGRLTAEGPKPQALPRPTLLCNSCPEAIMHGACQAGLVLSHHHTSILAFCHIHEHSLELYSWLTWVEIKIYTKIRSAVMTVHLKAGFPLLCHRNIGYFKAKVHTPITELSLGVFPLDLHWCCNILSVLYRKAFVWSSAYGCSGYLTLIGTGLKPEMYQPKKDISLSLLAYARGAKYVSPVTACINSASYVCSK